MASSRRKPPHSDPADVVRAARDLLANKKRGRHWDLGFGSFTEYAASLGHGAEASRCLLDLARVLEGLPDLVGPTESGTVSLDAARALAPVVRDPAVLRLPPDAEQPLAMTDAVTRWIEAARTLSAAALRSEVDLALERVRKWPEPLVPLRFELTPEEFADMEAACRLASELYERPISPAEMLEIATKEFLEEHDRG